MARRTTPVTKGRTTPKNVAASAAPAAEGAKPSRRGKAKPQDESPAEMPSLDAVSPADEQPAAEAETMSPKPRRGRKSKPEMTASVHDDDALVDSDIAPSPEPEVQAMEPAPTQAPERKKASKPTSSPRTTRRNREPEASAPPPLDMADELAADTPIASAVHWHAESGTVTFDWPAIEQVAAAEGVNQPMAKVLLAARAEGARSRWPF